MRDAVNDTVVLDEISSKLSKVAKKVNLSTQRMKNEYEKSHQFLDGEQYKAMGESIKSAIEAKDVICDEVEEAQRYIAKLKALIMEYSKFKF